MDWVDARDTFDLDNDRALDDQIDAITQIDSLAVIDHRKSYLSGNSESRLRSSWQTRLVGAFEQARMKLHRGGDNRAGHSVDSRRCDHCRGGHTFRFYNGSTDLFRRD